MSFEEIKLYIFSLFTFTLSFSTMDEILKIILLLVTIGYAIDKWINHRKNKFKN